MKFAFMQNPLTRIPFFAWIYNSYIISHLLEWLKVRQIKSSIRVNFDQCEYLPPSFRKPLMPLGDITQKPPAFLNSEWMI